MRSNFLLPLVVCLAACSDKKPPVASEFVGNWQCTKLSKSYTTELGDSLAASKCSLTLRADGTFDAKNLPEGDPARLKNNSGRWELTEGSTTPNGKWMIDLAEGQCWVTITGGQGNRGLKINIDPVNNWTAEYKRSK